MVIKLVQTSNNLISSYKGHFIFYPENRKTFVKSKNKRDELASGDTGPMHCIADEIVY